MEKIEMTIAKLTNTTNEIIKALMNLYFELLTSGKFAAANEAMTQIDALTDANRREILAHLADALAVEQPAADPVAADDASPLARCIARHCAGCKTCRPADLEEARPIDVEIDWRPLLLGC
jgi:hypothetical protein